MTKAPTVSRKRRFKPITIVVYFFAILITIINIFPTYWMTISAFKSTAEFYQRVPTWFPASPTLVNFQVLATLENPNFLRTLFNSGAEAALTAFVAVGVALLGAYSLARYRSSFGRYVRSYFFISQMVGGFFVLVPLFVVIKTAGFYDTYLAVMLPFLAFNLPFAIMLLGSFFSNLDVRMEESALIDGCSRLSAFRRIALPLSFPAALAAWLFVFLSVWGDFAITLTFTQSEASRTTVPNIWNLYNQPGFGTFFVPTLMLAIFLMTIPPTVIFVIFQKRFIQGLTAGAVKG